MNRRAIAVLFVIVVLAVAAGRADGSGAAPSAGGAHAIPQITVGPRLSAPAFAAPTSADCTTALASFGVVGTCYGPQDIRNEYDITPLISGGTDGSGQTIVIFDAFGSPTIASDLKTLNSASLRSPSAPALTGERCEHSVAIPFLAGPRRLLGALGCALDLGRLDLAGCEHRACAM
jgi:hypothetical protein